MVTLKYQERFKTIKGVFDEFTNRTLFDIQKKNVFDELLSPFSIGKESNVFLASKGNAKVIVKIYRVQNCDFKRMYDYIKQDPRYEFIKKKSRQIIFAWVQREYKNLLKAEKAKINVPKILGWKNHIIVEEMIGDEMPALKLKDSVPAYPFQFLEDILGEMRKLYKDAGLVHGALPPFNILNYQEKPLFIDFSKATLVKSRNAVELLNRDIKNVLNFFKKLGIEENAEKVFKKITE